jgi:uncharacterized protein
VIDPAAQPPAYAGLGQRTLALFLDSLIWFFFIGQVAANIPESVYDDEPVIVGVVFLALFSAAFNYFWLTEWKWGKTLGKAICSIHVTDENGGRPAFGPTTVRNLLRLVDVLVIGPVLIANTERRQRLGDRLAHTIVVRDQPARAPVPATPHPVAANPIPATPPARGVTNPAAADAGAAPAPAPPPYTPPVSPWSGKGIGIPKPEWRPITVVWGILTVIGLLIVESIVIAAFDPDLESIGSKLALQGALALTLIGVSLAYAGSLAAPVATLRRLGLRRFVASALGLAALTYFAYLIFAAIYGALVQPEQDDLTRELGLDEGGFGVVVAGVLIIAVAPVSEEVFFRGFMYGGLRSRLPVWAAAAISGAIFGLLHYTDPDSLTVVPQLALLGVVLAWLYERTGSLWPAIILHVINNAIAFAIVTS